MLSYEKKEPSVEVEALLESDLVVNQKSSWDLKTGVIAALSLSNVLMLVLVFVLQLQANSSTVDPGPGAVARSGQCNTYYLTSTRD
jgi:hypothetical protein